MPTLRELFGRLLGSFTRKRRDHDMEAELASHLELAAEDLQRNGRSLEDARRAARLQFGGADQAIEAMRDQRGLPWLDDLAIDVRHALRSLRHNPVFTAVALLTLALGIGANTAIFSVVNGVVLRPLNYSKPGQLMYLRAHYPLLQPSEGSLSYPEYEEFRNMNHSFAHVGAFMIGEANLTAFERPLRVRSARVDEHLLQALGVQPEHGRFFGPGETAAPEGSVGANVGGAAIAILSHDLWQGAFGGQPVVGRTVAIDGRPYEILGIMPSGVDLMDNRTQLWLPLGLQPGLQRSRGGHLLYAIGRLRDGVTEQAAQTELNTFLTNWAERATAKGHAPTNHPTIRADHSLEMLPLQRAIVGDASRSIWLLQVAVGFVLLIACANLGNLLMARSESRRREFALRAALGAGLSRLFRQAMTEGALLSFAGGALGIGLAAAGVRALIRTYPTSVPRMSEVAIDWRVLLFAFGVSIATGVLFGLAPVMQKRVNGLAAALKQSGDRATSDPGRHRVRRALVTAEVALAVMLVIGAGLLIRTVYNLTKVDIGFNRARMVTFAMTLPMATSEPDTRAQAYQSVLEKLRAVPGVQAASAMSGLPFGHENVSRGTLIENYRSPDGNPWEIVLNQLVMTDYFETMGIPIVAGRSFDRSDIAQHSKVIVVNETLAKAVWKDRNPIGQRLKPNQNGLNADPWHTVIGVAKSVKQEGVDQAARAEIYIFAEEQNAAPPMMNIVMRTTLPPTALSQTVEHLVKEVDPAVPVVRLRDMDGVFAESIRRPRLVTLLLGAFAGLALLLAAIGTYGMLSYMVTERRREIGIRMALGADRSSIFALVMKQGLWIAMIGIVIGLAGSFALNGLIQSLLFGVQAGDTTTMAAVAASILLVAALACGLPAWRASRLAPNVMLKHE